MNKRSFRINQGSIFMMCVLFALTLLFPSSYVSGASFNCNKSHTFIEHAICSNRQLSGLDEKLDRAYKKTLQTAIVPDSLKEEQRVWLTDERNVCQDVACLTQVYKQRLESLATYSERESIVDSRKSCEFSGLILPAEYSIFAAGGYSGRKLNTQIDESGHVATQMDVEVNISSKPVVLMLGAYEPTIWNVRWSKTTRIAAVLVSGYHRQAVAGIDPAVPVLNTSYDNKGPCGYFYVGENDLSGLNPMSRRFFGRSVDMVYLSENGKIVIGEAVPAGLELVTSKATSPESFYDRTALPPGSAGLELAVQKGLLRRATEADIDAWVRTVRPKMPKRDVPPVAGQGDVQPTRPSLTITECILSTDASPCKVRYNAYVVLKQFTCPAGLYESSAKFFILKGVPRPKGNCANSEIYDFNNAEYLGVGPAR
jgi:uncharacterized protein YecT (DUF1311 family)